MKNTFKKLCASFLVICVIVSSAALTSCESLIPGNTDDKDTTYVKTESGENIPVLNIEQTAIKNENYLDTEVSWYNDDYNYWVFDIGKIKNVPLTSTYATINYYGDATMSVSRTVTTATVEDIETSTSMVVSKSVKTSFTGSASVTIGADTKLKNGVQTGFSMAITNEATKQNMWTETYKKATQYSESYEDSLTLTFDKSCKNGKYVLQLKTIIF